MLVAEGRLELQGNAYIPLGDLTSFAVPDTLSALIAARLDALDPADRAIVQDASVLGQSFTVAALAGVGGRPEEELEARLRGLVRRELLRVEARSALARARPVRLRAGPDPRSRLQHARAQRSQDPPPRGRSLLRGARRRGARGRARRSVPLGARQRRTAGGSRGARGPGADRPARRRPARRGPGIPRSGRRVPAQSGHGHVRARRAGGSARGGRVPHPIGPATRGAASRTPSRRSPCGANSATAWRWPIRSRCSARRSSTSTTTRGRWRCWNRRWPSSATSGPARPAGQSVRAGAVPRRLLRSGDPGL